MFRPLGGVAGGEARAPGQGDLLARRRHLYHSLDLHLDLYYTII